MRLLKFHLISLLLILTFLFNVERIDFGNANVLNIQTFVYILAIFITITILLVPFFSQYRVTAALAYTLALYIICKLIIFRDRPFLGGSYTYLSITEAAFLAILAITSQRVSQSLNEFQKGLEAMTLSLGGAHLQKISKASEAIRREITRSRHYLRPFSVIVVEPDVQSFNLTLPTIFEELQKAMINRFARIKLAQDMRQHLRLMDLILEEDNSCCFIILCPEVDNDGSAAIVKRVQTVMEQSGVTAHYSVATFPEDALTFEGLLNRAKAKLNEAPEQDNETPEKPSVPLSP